MAQIKRILLATDFSPCSQGAVEATRDLAAPLGAAVIVLHVGELPPGLDPAVPVHPDAAGPTLPVGEYVSQAAERSLKEVLELLRAAGVPATARVELGPVIDTVLRVALAEGVDLIVVGTHGRTGLRHLFLGSIAERLVRTAPVPVLTVRRDSTDALSDAEEQARVEVEG